MDKEKIKVTDLELVILQQIWDLNNLASVNEILNHWPEENVPGYTTILKTLQKMEKKQIVDHQKEGKSYSYFSNISKEQITNRRLNTIINRIFSGNKISFAEHFIDQGSFNSEELKELKKLISKKEKEAKK
jgi:BlaI family transcriptional regulator, penicillinase repressor